MAKTSKVWLGTKSFFVTEEQYKELNEVAEKVYRATSDRSKGLQAAIDYCEEQQAPADKPEA